MRVGNHIVRVAAAPGAASCMDGCCGCGLTRRATAKLGLQVRAERIDEGTVAELLARLVAKVEQVEVDKVRSN